MPHPVLLVIDGDLDALSDVEAQLVRRYGDDYRVASTNDPAEAIRHLAELADEGAEWPWCWRPSRSRA